MRLFSVLALLILPASLAFAAPDAPITRGELDGLIRQYLLDHPETIVDALESMQRKEQEVSSAKAEEAVQKHKDVVYDDSMTPVIGAAKAPVTVVVFSDYNCSACKFMFEALEQVMKDDAGKTRLLIKEFPIFGAKSDELASIGIAAYKIDGEKYFAFHAAMMKAPGRADAAKVDAALTTAGYDVQAVRDRATKQDIKDAIQRNHALGQAMGVRGTPTLIVGDEVVPHALNYSALKEKINEQAAKKK